MFLYFLRKENDLNQTCQRTQSENDLTSMKTILTELPIEQELMGECLTEGDLHSNIKLAWEN